MYGKGTGSAWNVGTVDTPAGGPYWIGHALDSLGRGHVSYSAGSNFNTLKYAKWTGTAWSPETVDSSSGGEGSAIAIDGAGRPQIAYYHKSTGDLNYAKWTGTAW